MDKREQILSALAELAHTRGVYRVTVDELASRAGVSKRTIYRYFRSKDEIVEALLDRFMNEMAGQVEHIIDSGDKPADILTGVVKFAARSGRTLINPLVLDDLRRYYPGLWNKIEKFRADKIQQNFIKVLIKNRKEKDLRQIDPGILSAAFTASVQAVVNPEFILNNGLTFEETVKQLIELFMHGIIDDKAGRAEG